MVDALREIINNATVAFVDNDLALASKVEPLEQVIDRLRDKLKDAHVKRLTNGTCTIELGFVFSDLITNIERVSDHCSNIAIGVIEINRNGYDAHEYLHELKIPMIFSTTQITRLTSRSTHFQRKLCL